ncbi:MAG: hypothetical protein ACRDFB_09125, partial [Rhabdochlamydiaceae bacterium]
MRNLQQELTTQDMGLTVALLCTGYELDSLEPPSSGRRVTFKFRAKNGIEQATQEYWDGKLTVDAKQYW